MLQRTRARLTACLIALLAVACAPDTAGERVAVRVRLESAMQPRAGALHVALNGGWTVHIEEARVSLGPIYLRAPRRERLSLWGWLVPTAYAHPEHAQTLREGQVIGELLRSVVFDTLTSGPLEVDTVLVQSSRVERLSVTLTPSSSSDSTRGHVAVVRGWAEHGEQRVDFDCGLDIEQDPDETPENLAERRRVDQILLDGAPWIGERDTLVLRMHPELWLERVDFDALVGLEQPCPGSLSRFAAQWYLGLRRPEAFSAELMREGE